MALRFEPRPRRGRPNTCASRPRRLFLRELSSLCARLDKRPLNSKALSQYCAANGSQNLLAALCYLIVLSGVSGSPHAASLLWPCCGTGRLVLGRLPSSTVRTSEQAGLQEIYTLIIVKKSTD
jgi:hypothetical protein